MLSEKNETCLLRIAVSVAAALSCEERNTLVGTQDGTGAEQNSPSPSSSLSRAAELRPPVFAVSLLVLAVVGVSKVL